MMIYFCAFCGSFHVAKAELGRHDRDHLAHRAYRTSVLCSIAMATHLVLSPLHVMSSFIQVSQ